ncbi:MAG: hypothetical protein ACREJT_03055 [Myxococcota bacterium]
MGQHPPVYCLNYDNESRRQSMVKRFAAVGLNPSAVHVYGGIAESDPRIAGRGLDSHVARVWSCAYGHLDMIRTFVERDTSAFGLFCEDDLLIDAAFGARVRVLVPYVEAVGLDLVLLGYLLPFQLSLSATTCTHVLAYRTPEADVRYGLHLYGQDLWGTQMYLLSRVHAETILDRYANGYADQCLALKSQTQVFASDFMITKTGNRRMLYPMLAIEDGLATYTDVGQQMFHAACHTVQVKMSTYV